MTSQLPDIAMTRLATGRAPLDWVGMAGIDLPLYIDEPG